MFVFVLCSNKFNALINQQIKYQREPTNKLNGIKQCYNNIDKAAKAVRRVNFTNASSEK